MQFCLQCDIIITLGFNPERQLLLVTFHHPHASSPSLSIPPPPRQLLGGGCVAVCFVFDCMCVLLAFHEMYIVIMHVLLWDFYLNVENK